MSDWDYYRALGVGRDATAAQIRAAFAREAKRSHPDLTQPGTAIPNRMPALQQAFRTLSRPEARAAYDVGLIENERRVSAARARAQRRLRRYDRGRTVRSGRRPWRPLILLACVAAAALRLSLG